MISLSNVDPQPTDLDLDKPVLLIVVDTEEEFDWKLPFDREATTTHSIVAQDRAHAIYDRFGVVPTYVMDYPVASSPIASRYLRSLVDAGRADFGTHCHPWVTPPHVEKTSVFNSFHGNLPLELEAAKIRNSTDVVAQAFGRAPTIFKAGRYGLGPNTLGILKELGYAVDCSYVPHTSFALEGGPNFHHTPDQPFFTDAGRTLLEVPMTVGVTGLMYRTGRRVPTIFDHPWSKAWRVPGIASRLGLLERLRLTPEGFGLASHIRLMSALLDQGVKVFTMTYHSPTLKPGNTSYVRNDEDLALFLATIEGVLSHFKDRLGGRFSTLSEINRLAKGRELSPAEGLKDARGVRPSPAQDPSLVTLAR